MSVASETANPTPATGDKQRFQWDDALLLEQKLT